MAQRDIQDIANYMKQVDESKIADEEAHAVACKECEQQQALEDEELEDEVIDKVSLGFIDDADIQDEADDFYSEDEDTFNEDVSDCLEKEVVEAEQLASIEVEVYNEDGFGEHFIEEVKAYVPGIEASKKKDLPNKDILVKIVGSKEDLQKAFAFYLGQNDYGKLDRDDKEDFESRLVFADGDTLAEADYREAVAHCLDPIGVNASTADLAAQDTCKLSIVKEEKLRRQGTRMAKALKESDFSALSDEDLEKLDTVKDKIDGGKPLTHEENKLWRIILADIGFTPEEWSQLTPEEQDKVWAKSEEPAISRTGFAPYMTKVDPKTGKTIKYQVKHEVFNPKTGEVDVTQFNPNYTSELSYYQHPSAFKRAQKKMDAAKEQQSKEEHAKEAMKKARGKDTWDQYDFAQMITALDNQQRKDLMEELIAAVEEDNKDNPRKAGDEIMFIKTLFGKKLTLRDIAKAWGKTHTGVRRFSDETIAIWKKTLDEVGIRSRKEFASMPRSKFNLFLDTLKKNMGSRKKGSIVSGQ